MEKYTLESLPHVVGKIEEKLNSIEKLLLQPQPSPSPIVDLLTISEAAKFLKLTVPTLYSKVSRREIPVNKKGKRLYFSRSELLAWIKSGKKKTQFELSKEAERLLSKNGKKHFK